MFVEEVKKSGLVRKDNISQSVNIAREKMFMKQFSLSQPSNLA